MNIQPGTLPPNAGLILAVLAGIILLILLRGRLGRSLLLGLQRVQEVCAILVHKGLHLDQLLEQRKDVSTVTASPASPALVETTNEGEHQEQPSEPTEQQEKIGSEVFMIAVRLLGLLFTLDVLMALLILDGIRTGIVVFQNEASAGLVKLPISIPTVMGLLGWSMIVLMGSFLMEVVMKRWPAGLEFLPPFWREGKASRILFRWLIGAGNVILFTYVLLLGLVAQLQLYHVQWPAAGVIVAALQMVLANLVGLFALWIVVLGLGALFSTICLIIQVVCSILLLLLRAWVKPGKVLVGMVAQGGAIVPGGAGGVGGNLGASPNQMWGESGQWEKESRSTLGTGVDDDREMPKAKVAKYQSSMVSTGASGLRLLTATLDDPWTLSGLKGAVRSMGYTPTKRPPDRSVGQKIRQRGSIDISNSPGEVQIARQQPGNEISLLLNQQRLKLQQHTPKTAGHELTLWAMDWQQVLPAVEPVTRLAQAEPRQVLVPVVEVPVNQLGEPEVHEALEALVSLWQKGVIKAAILTDRQVATVRVVRKTQTLYLAHSLNGVIASHMHHEENPTGADLFTLLGKKTPFVSLASGSIPLNPGGKLSAFDAGRWTVGSSRGRGNVEDVRLSMGSLGEMLLTDEASRLFPARVDLTRAPLCGEVFVPFPQDKRFQAVCEGLELWSADTVPGATMMFIAGPGVKDGTAMGAVDVHYVGQWTWFFGFGMDEVLVISQTAEEPAEEPEVPVRRTNNNARPLAKGTPVPAAKSPARRQGSVRPQTEAKPVKRGRRTPLRAVELPKNDDQRDDQDDAWVL